MSDILAICPRLVGLSILANDLLSGEADFYKWNLDSLLAMDMRCMAVFRADWPI